MLRSPDSVWDSAFKKEVKSYSNQSLPLDEAQDVIEQLRERQRAGRSTNTADMTASIVLNDGIELQKLWEEYVQPGLVEVARNYGDAGRIVLQVRSYLDNPDVARRATRHIAHLLTEEPSLKDPNQSVLDLSRSALGKGLDSFDLDPSGFSLIRMVHNPDYFALVKQESSYPRIATSLVRFGFIRYQAVYRQLDQLGKTPVRKIK